MKRLMRRISAIFLAAVMFIGFMPAVGNVAGLTRAETNVYASDSNNEIVSISAGNDMSAAVRADGSVWTWGCNDLKSIYDRSWDVRKKGLGLAEGAFVESTPTMVMSVSALSVECGTQCSYYSDHMVPCTAILKDDGSLWMWGGGAYGVLGNGKTVATWQPSKVMNDVISYTTSGLHSAAITSDGSLYMWGYNNCGQIGDGTNDNATSPVKIMDNVAEVSLGEQFSAAVRKDGTLWLWGLNNRGQLGNDSYESSNVPIQIMSDVKSVSLGNDFCLALTKDKTLYVWGNNTSGQLGIGNNTSQSVPVLNGDFDNDINMIEAGSNMGAAILENGDLYMWGGNAYGGLGIGNTTSSYETRRVMSGIKDVSIGYGHTLALGEDGSLWAWGLNSSGQLGDHTTTKQTKPKEIALGSIEADFNADGTKNSLDLTWDDAYLNANSGTYNENLSMDSLILSEAAYGNGSVLEQFGFTIVSNGLSNDSVDEPGYLVGYKIMYDFDEPQVEIIMAIRGTKSPASGDALTDIKSVNDGFDGPTAYCYDKLSTAKAAIASKIGTMGLSTSKKNTKYLIVGHSLGGACAGKLALKMGNDGVAYTNNIYAYTFAAPNYTNLESKLDTTVDVPGIFNIVNTADAVPKIPSVMYHNWVFKMPLYKAGKTFNLSCAENLSTFNSIIYSIYGEIPWDTYLTYKAHMTPTYYALLKSCKQDQDAAEGYYDNAFFGYVRVLCPVDVQVYDSDGDLCAYTEGEDVTYTNYSAVRIMTSGDEKYIELPDGEFVVKYIGTDSGTMDIEDQVLSVETGEVIEEKTFEAVTLESGKMFESSIDTDEETGNTELFVTNEDGKKMKSVDTDGTETYVDEFDVGCRDITLSETEFDYDGTAKTPSVSVEGLTQDTDYTLEYENNVEVGTAKVTVTGTGDYKGTATKKFAIRGELTDGDIVIAQSEYTYTGSQITPEAEVYFNGSVLEENTDYTIEYGENTEPGEGSVTVTGTGLYKGEAAAAFTILKADYDMSGIGFADQAVSWNGAAHKLAITGTLPKGVGVSYEGNGQSDPGAYTVTAKFTGDPDHYNEIPDMTAVLAIIGSDIEGVSVEGYSGTYDGSAHGIAVTVPEGCTIKYGTEEGAYDLDDAPEYADAGAYPVYYKITKEGCNPIIDVVYIDIRKAVYDMSGIGFANKTVTYSGQPQSIEITGTLPEGVSVSYDGNGKSDAGIYNVTALFTGDEINYESIGSMAAVLTIKEPDVPVVSISKPKAAKKAVTVKWKKASGVTGYQIQYGLKSSFKGAKTVKVAKASATSKKVTKLKAKKKYYVRVRAYKVVSGTTFYGAWSAKKSVKTK